MIKKAREIDYSSPAYHVTRKVMNIGSEAELRDAYPIVDHYLGRPFSAGMRAKHTGEPGGVGGIMFGEAEDGIYANAILISAISGLVAMVKRKNGSTHLRRALKNFALGSGIVGGIYAAKGGAEYLSGKALGKITPSPFI